MAEPAKWKPYPFWPPGIKRCGALDPGGEQCMYVAGHELPHKIDPDVHRCHVKGCSIPVPPERLFCLPHWKMVPKHMRDRIWATYRDGQCDTKDPSAAWHEAADAAIAYVARLEIKEEG